MSPQSRSHRESRISATTDGSVNDGYGVLAKSLTEIFLRRFSRVVVEEKMRTHPWREWLGTQKCRDEYFKWKDETWKGRARPTATLGFQAFKDVLDISRAV